MRAMSSGDWRYKCKRIPCRECNGEGVVHHTLLNMLEEKKDIACRFCEGKGYLLESANGCIKAWSGEYRGYNRSRY